MVEILPFKGLRYSIKKIGSYSKVLAQPYDVIDENKKIILKNFSPYNIVHLTLPDDTDKKNRYESARDILSGWINEEILEPDRDESFYIFRENFMEEGVKKSFAGFAALLKIEEYDEGTVLRHEKTLPKPKEDRLNLLTACRTNFEFIYTVFDDHDKKVTDIINATMQHIPDVASDVLYDKTLSFDLWTVKNKKDLEKITGLMKNKTVLIADGHHRYETSRLYRESTEKPDLLKPENIKTAEDYIMCLFVPGIKKEISIHPTHRLDRKSVV